MPAWRVISFKVATILSATYQFENQFQSSVQGDRLDPASGTRTNHVSNRSLFYWPFFCLHFWSIKLFRLTFICEGWTTTRGSESLSPDWRVCTALRFLTMQCPSSYLKVVVSDTSVSSTYIDWAANWHTWDSSPLPTRRVSFSRQLHESRLTKLRNAVSIFFYLVALDVGPLKIWENIFGN